MPRKSKESGVISPETKKLNEEQEITEKLQEQLHEQNLEKAKKIETKVDISPREVVMTKAQYQKIIDTYKEQNPVKYERKKEALAKRLAALPA